MASARLYQGSPVNITVTRGNVLEEMSAFCVANVVDDCPIYREGDQILVNGFPVGMSTTLDEGDIITLIPVTG